MADDTRDRLIALEVEVRNLSRASEKMAETLERIDGILNKADGARWAVIGIAALAGFLSSKAGAVVAALWK